MYDFPLCPGCMKKIATLSVHEKCRRDTALDGLLVMTTFQDEIKTLITDIKYSYFYAESHTLGVLLAHYLVQARLCEAVHPRVIFPVPLHRRKQMDRGFNQSELLARDLQKALGVPMSSQVLKKVKATPAQAGLDRKSRLQNSANAYKVSIKLRKSDTIIIVDDVVTTGSTLSACAKALKQAGAGKVYGVAVAHGH